MIYLSFNINEHPNIYDGCFSVGEGIRQAIAAGHIASREELWVTSKLWCTFLAKEHVPLALEKTLEDLGEISTVFLFSFLSQRALIVFILNYILT
jgi:diketogulonate reductase-like aldo/keto reductase